MDPAHIRIERPAADRGPPRIPLAMRKACHALNNPPEKSMHRLARAHGPRLRFLHVLKELCPRGHETRWETAYDRLVDGGKTRRFCGPSRWARMGEIHAGFERRTWKAYLDVKGEV